jgi:hypothetical protein
MPGWTKENTEKSSVTIVGIQPETWSRELSRCLLPNGQSYDVSTPCIYDHYLQVRDGCKLKTVPRTQGMEVRGKVRHLVSWDFEVYYTYLGTHASLLS